MPYYVFVKLWSMAPKPAECTEKERLMRNYQKAAVAYSEAVTLLQQKMGISPREEYDRMNRVADGARLNSEGARLAFEQHRADHGC